MPSDFAPEYGLWAELILVLSVGTAAIVVAAALAVRCVRAATWRRAIWQAAALGILALLLLEATGTGSALVGLCRFGREPSSDPGEVAMSPLKSPTREYGIDELEAPALPKPGVSGAIDEDTEHTRWLGQSAAVAPDAEEVVASLHATAGHSHGLTPELDSRWFERLDAALAITEQVQVAGPKHDNASRDSATRGFAALSHQPPNVQPPSGHHQASDTPKATTSDASSEEAETAVLPAEAASLTPVGSWWPVWIWLLAAAVIAMRACAARAMLFRFRRRHVPTADVAVRRRVDRLARRLGVRRAVGVLQSARLQAPVAFGVFRPTIVLPKRFGEEFTPRQQEAMLAHELGHLAGGDPVWLLLTDLLTAVLWWHPAAWWLRRKLRAAGEAAADEASLAVPGGPDVLAGCLVAMGRRLVHRPRLGWLSVGGSGFRSSLGRRVQRLLDLKPHGWRSPRRGRLAWAKTVGPVVLVIVGVSCSAWARVQAPTSEGGTVMSVMKISWRRSLAAAALVTLLSTAPNDAVAQDRPDGEREGAVDQPREEPRGDDARRDGEGDRPREEGERREGDRPREEGERRESDRPREEGERREGDRPREEGERREGDRPREEGDRPREEGERRERPDQPREEAEAREVDVPQERLRAHLQELEVHAADLMARFRETPEDRADAREEIAREIRAAQERMEAIRAHLRRPEREAPPREREEHARSEAEGHMRALEVKAHQLEERAQAIRRQMEELPDGAADRAEMLEAQMREIHQAAEQVERQMHELRERHQPRPEGPPPGEREEIARHLEELEREIHRLSELGRHEEAEQLKRAGRELVARLRGQPEPPRPDRPHGEEMERRIHHLRVAIENLQAAGMHDQARQLAQQVERMMHGGEPGPAHREAPLRLENPFEGQPPVIREMQEQMDQMRREMEEMRGLLKELLERR